MLVTLLLIHILWLRICTTNILERFSVFCILKSKLEHEQIWFFFYIHFFWYKCKSPLVFSFPGVQWMLFLIYVSRLLIFHYFGDVFFFFRPTTAIVWFKFETLMSFWLFCLVLYVNFKESNLFNFKICENFF